ncbi:hypothetical protein GCM10009099_31980 [Caenispirillum bisanense]
MLHLWSPNGHVSRKLMTAAREAGVATDGLGGGRGNRADVTVPPGGLAALAATLAAPLSAVEREAVRALFLAAGAEPTLDSMAQVAPLGRLAARAEVGWLDRLLAEERLISHFQPIVTPDGRPFAVEALVRATDDDGSLIGGGRIMSAARAGDMLFAVDLAARATAVRTAAAHGYAGRLFINFSPAAIYDPDHCLRSTVALIKASGLPPENVVFEVGEADSLESIEHLKNILRVYRSAGFKVALDDLGAGYASLNLLHEVRPDFVKVDMGLVRDVDTDAYKAAVLGNLLRMVRDLGIPTVCEGVETAGEARWLAEAGADLLQGYLYGRPRAEPPAAAA